MMNALVRILLKFRKNKFAAKADIEKAFLMVGIHPADRDLLRILWIENGEVIVYRFTRLPFGLCCSPFLLAAVMRHTLYSEELDDETRDAILASFYVDDSVFSEPSIKKLLSRRDVSKRVFGEAGMNLREWTSNDQDLRKLFGLDEVDRELPDYETPLGIFWDLDSDMRPITSSNLSFLENIVFIRLY